MNYKVSQQSNLAESRAKTAALLLADLAGWNIEIGSLMLPVEANGYLLAPAIDLLIIPAVGPVGPQLGKISLIACQTRCDALVISVSETTPAHLYCAVGKWSSNGISWSLGMFWMTKFAEPWIIPEPTERNANDLHFPLLPGRLCAAKNPHPEALANPDGGFYRADHVLAVAGVE